MQRVVLIVLVLIHMCANSQNPMQVNGNSSHEDTSATLPVLIPPVARKVHTQKTVNGKTLVDDYAWLRERSNPEVKALLEAENAYAEYVMKPTEPLQKSSTTRS